MEATKSLPRRHFALVGAAIAFVSIALGTSAGSVQEQLQQPGPKYGFPDIEETGDAYTVDDSMDLRMDAVISANGQMAPMKTFRRSRLVYSDEVLAVSKGKVTNFRRSYAIHRTSDSTPSGEMKTTVSTLQGKTVTVSLSNGRATVTTASGRIAPDDLKELKDGAAVDSSDVRLVPHRELAPGEEWNLPTEILARAFNGLNRGTAKGRFERVYQQDARPVAEFKFALDLLGNIADAPAEMTLKGSGTSYYDLELKRLFGSQYGGPMTMEGDIVEGGRKFHVSGQGSLDARFSVRWLKKAGKPVKASFLPSLPPTSTSPKSDSPALPAME